jgi:MoaA/NifB/PqqE/SkfB family radical SAM enzyme
MSDKAVLEQLGIGGDIVGHNPRHVWIEPTNRCNTRCTHCGHFYSKFGQDMDRALYHRVAASVLDDLKTIELIGYGEPFMAKHFDEMFDECASRGIHIFTTSNGILLRDDARVSKVVRSLMTLCLSIDGATKETLEFVRPYIKWEKMLETLECIKRNADAAGPEKRFAFRINFVAMKNNIADLPEMVRLAGRYGADEVFVLPLGGEEVFEKMNGQSLDRDPQMVVDAYMKALPEAFRLGVQLQIPPAFYQMLFGVGAYDNTDFYARPRVLLRKLRLGVAHAYRKGLSATLRKSQQAEPEFRAKAGVTWCSMPWNDSYFASDGTVFPCCVMGEKLGDMNKQSWEEIWNGSAYQNLRRTIHSWNPTSVCRTCTLPNGINGGDPHYHHKFFGHHHKVAIPLDSENLKFSDGFYELERTPDGAPSHIWMDKGGKISVRLRDEAKFVRIVISAREAIELNPGRCFINDAGEPEPFDNSCAEIHFPANKSKSDWITFRLQMENAACVPPDPRQLALCIRGIEILH